MPEISFWRDLASRFHQLQQEYSHRLAAHWSSSPWNESGDMWRLDGGANEVVRGRFKAYAERAAIELGHYDESSALFFWLDLLKKETPFYNGCGQSTGRAADGTEVTSELGSIELVCGVSAEFCLKCETRAILQNRASESRVSNGPAVSAEVHDRNLNEQMILQLAENFRKTGEQFQLVSDRLRAEFIALPERAAWGIWKLRPNTKESEAAREKFQLVATLATREFGIAPIAAPQAHEFDPNWSEEARRSPNPDGSEPIPSGLNEVDPCTRAWLHFLRLEAEKGRSKAFEIWNGGISIPDVWEASAVQCDRSAREQIQAGLTAKQPQQAEKIITDSRGGGGDGLLVLQESAQRMIVDAFRAYAGIIHATEWASYDDGETAEFVRIFIPVVRIFAVAELEPIKESEKRGQSKVEKRIFNLLKATCTRGLVPATWPWRADLMFENTGFREAIRTMICREMSLLEKERAEKLSEAVSVSELGGVPNNSSLGSQLDETPPMAKSGPHAVCPVVVPGQTQKPRVFSSIEQASQWLSRVIEQTPNSKETGPGSMNLTDVGSHNERWRSPVRLSTFKEYDPSVPFEGSILNFLPLTIRRIPDGPALESKIDRFLKEESPEIACCLADDWEFEKIALSPRVRLGRYNLVEQTGMIGMALQFACDLETSLNSKFPQLPSAAVADFWRSWQTSKYLADCCYELGQSEAATALLKHSEIADSAAKKIHGFLMTQVTAFAQGVVDGNLANPMRSNGNAPADALKPSGESVKGTVMDKNDPRTWSPAVQQWEALKAIKAVHMGPIERIPEVVLRSDIASPLGIRPEDVSEEQLLREVGELIKHYGAVELIRTPTAPDITQVTESAENSEESDPDQPMAPETPSERDKEFQKVISKKGDATLLTGKLTVNFRTTEEYLGITHRQRQKLIEIFTVTALPSGNRKTAVFSAATKPLDEYEAAETQKSVGEVAQALAGRKIKEARLKRLQEQAANGDKKVRMEATAEATELAAELASESLPVPVQLVVDDCTTERLPTLLKNQRGRMAVMSPEGDIFDLMAGRYSAGKMTNFGVYLKAHAGDTLRVDQVGRPAEHVKAPALTIGLAVQPHVISGLAEKPGFRGRGLLGRFLYSLPKSLLGHRDTDPPPIPDQIRAKYHENVAAILNFPLDLDATGEPRAEVLTLDPDARAELRRFENWVEPQLDEFGQLGEMTDWARKLVGAVIRIAGLLHMAEIAGARCSWRTEISAATFMSAVAIGKYLIPHARAAFALMGADQNVQRATCVLRRITHNGVAQFTKRDLHQGLRSQFPSVTDLDSPLSLLIDHAFLREQLSDKPAGAGRPRSPSFDVNPLWNRESAQKTNSEYCEYFESGTGPSPETLNRGPQKGLE